MKLGLRGTVFGRSGKVAFVTLTSFFVAIFVGCAPGAVTEAGDDWSASAEELAGMINSESVGPAGAGHERAVLGMHLFDSRGEIIGTCSTILIRPDVILLTAHCFDKNLNRGLHSARLYLTHDLNTVDLNDRSSRVIVNHISHPLYDSKAKIVPYGQNQSVRHPFYDHDLAIAFLDRPVDSSIQPQQIATTEQRLTSGMKLTAYGFGRSVDYTDARGTPAALRFKTRQRGYLIVSDKMLEDRNYTRIDSKSRLCQGDSGGPAYLVEKNKAPVAVGLNSASGGKLIHAESGLRKCDGVSVLQPIAPMREWIDRTLRENGR